MSRYSFIDETINMSGKQCFCIDVNSSNSPFVTTGVSETRPQPVAAPSAVPVPKPLSTDLHALIRHENAELSNDQNFLLTPQVINAPLREQKIIETANSLLNQTYQNITSEGLAKQVQALNEVTIDLPKTSLTVDTDPKLVSKIDLNKMANDTKVGKKVLRKSSDNLSLFEGFESGGCTDTCKPKSRKQQRRRLYRSRRSRPQRSNENFYLIVIIILLLAISWFRK
jgi:hypothetical protein